MNIMDEICEELIEIIEENRLETPDDFNIKDFEENPDFAIEEVENWAKEEVNDEDKNDEDTRLLFATMLNLCEEYKK